MTSIGNHAFSCCGHLTVVSFGGGIRSIGDGAFRDCGSLSFVNIPGSVRSIGIGAFRDCSSLTSVVIPGSVAHIGSLTFSGCTLLEDVRIGNGVTSIGRYMFRRCICLAYLTIPDSVTSIEENAFESCVSLSDIKIPDSVAAIEDNAFEHCARLTDLVLRRGVVTIGDGAFRDCDRLQTAAIPDSVVSIGNSAFSGCRGMKKLDLGRGLATIGDWAFEGCIGLTCVSVPDSVTFIGNNAFGSCTGMNRLVLGRGVATISDLAFSSCISLTDVSVPDSVISVGKNAFSHCGQLRKITFRGKAPRFSWPVFEEVTATAYYPPGDPSWADAASRDPGGAVAWKPYPLPVTAAASPPAEKEERSSAPGHPGIYTAGPYRCTVLGDGTAMVAGYTGNDSMVTIPPALDGHTVTAVGDSAFEDCLRLRSVTIPAGVTDVGESAFGGCAGLRTVTFLGGAPRFGGAAFRGVTAAAYYSPAEPGWTNAVRRPYGGDIIWMASSPPVPGSAEEPGKVPETARLCAPESIRGTCGDRLVWELAVYGANADGTNVYYISVTGSGDMDHYSSPADVPWYSYREHIDHVYIRGGVTGIGIRAFDGGVNLRRLDIPASVAGIGAFAFRDCRRLADIYADPVSCFFSAKSGILYNREKTALVACPAARGYLIIPDSVSLIAGWAFEGCEGLQAIRIGKNVTGIGERAFSGCTGLRMVIFEGSAPAFGESVFEGVTAAVSYPAGDSSWALAIRRQDLGGRITWAARGSSPK